MSGSDTALEIRIQGVVQGVGFRPFVHRLALRFGLSGWVRNEAGSVRILAQGPEGALDRLLSTLRSEAPPMARVDGIEVRAVPPKQEVEFRIESSDPGPHGRLPVSPDLAICPACLSELNDPLNRRYRFPFITCTDCGPRFTVIEAMPYDRERTSMSAFVQCPDCQREYRDPVDRRYHSETNSCQRCGPRIWYEGVAPEDLPPGGQGPARWGGRTRPSSSVLEGEAALVAAAGLLRAGGILALRGLGGFHLAVDATNENAVRRLRRRKGREEKPLAIMARNLEGVREVGHLNQDEEGVLASPESPIVLLPKRDGSSLAPSVAPGLSRVGVMIPYTPLHHLLMEEAGIPLVMTSGNLSEAPIIIGNTEARDRLDAVADGHLLHDREIVARCDDSVVQVVDGALLLHRRARGFAPLPVPLPIASPRPLLAMGPHLKNTFTLAQGDSAYISQHIGDLENLETLGHARDSILHLRRLVRIEPEVVVRDLHPGYLSTRLAHELADSMGALEVLAVQHHHAHVAAVLAEHGEVGPVVGVAFDGTGYGDDGCVWGAEVLVADLVSYRRVGHLRYSPLPGGEAAVRNPWRAVLGYLSLEPEREEALKLAFRGVSGTEQAVVFRQARKGVNAPLASSMGRLFDASAAVLGLRNVCAYDAQGAMEMEAAASGLQGRPNGSPDADEPALPFPVEKNESGIYVMDPLPLLSALGQRRREGIPLASLARAFHDAVARTTADLVEIICDEEGLSTVALSGGVFQNALLLRGTRHLLEERGLRVLVPRRLSPNDGAISYGQAAVAAARIRSRLTSKTPGAGDRTDAISPRLEGGQRAQGSLRALEVTEGKR